MTAQTQPAQTEAIRLADWIDSDFDPDDMAEFGFDQIAAELRRLHAENAQLRESRKPLSDEEIREVWASMPGFTPDPVEFARALGIGEKTP